VVTTTGRTSPVSERPRVTLKIAQSLDGRIATRSGDSKWITGIDARRSAHALRAQYDAVLVGIGTILADDPQLTVRHVEGANPMRIVLDSRLRIPLDAAILNVEDAPTVVVTGTDHESGKRRRLEARGVRVLTAPSEHGRVSLSVLMQMLLASGITSIMVEGGPTVWTSLLRERLADRAVIYIAPRILGTGRDAVGDLDISRVANSINLADVSWTRVGEDFLIEGTPVWGNTAP
jgi:riboflavin-specific deaminase-like protein